MVETLLSTPHRPVRAATLLSQFDALRRRMAVDVAGTAGFSIGYHLLKIDWAALRRVGQSAHVTMSAEVVAVRRGAHEVEYAAWITGSEGDRPPPLIVARGWTQIPPPRTTSDPSTAQQRNCELPEGPHELARNEPRRAELGHKETLR